VQLYRANFSRLLTIAAIGGVPQIPLALMIDPGNRKPASLHFTPGLAVAGVAAALFAFATSGALGKMAVAIHDGAALRPGEALRISLVRLPSLVAAGFLAALATVAGLALLIFPGIYLLLGFSLSYLVIVAEGLGPWAALRRSWRLAHHLRTRIFNLMLVWGLLQIVLSYAIGGLLGLLGLAGPVGRLGQQLSSILIAPCYSLALCLTYFDARAAKEGEDLAREAERLAAGTPPP
jgi:hypothetical protein